MSMPSLRYAIIEVTDLITRRKSFKIYERPAGNNPPLAAGIATREEAEAKLRELDGEVTP